MKIHAPLSKIVITILTFFSFSLTAQTLETNIQGLVIKDYKCTSEKYVRGNLINRNVESFVGALRVKIIDRENDIIWQGVNKINVGGQNGADIFVPLGVGTCMPPNKVLFTLER